MVHVNSSLKNYKLLANLNLIYIKLDSWEYLKKIKFIIITKRFISNLISSNPIIQIKLIKMKIKAYDLRIKINIHYYIKYM